MSTMVQIPVRVNPPPAEPGDTISPICAFLTVTTPGERRTHDVIVQKFLLPLDLEFRHADVRFRVAQIGGECIDGRLVARNSCFGHE